jgi:hypothetical protein
VSPGFVFGRQNNRAFTVRVAQPQQVKAEPNVNSMQSGSVCDTTFTAPVLVFHNEEDKQRVLHRLIERKKTGQQLSDMESQFCRDELTRLRSAHNAQLALENEWRKNREEFERTAQILQQQAREQRQLEATQKYMRERKCRSRSIVLAEPVNAQRCYHDEFNNRTMQINSDMSETCIDVSPCGISVPKPAPASPSEFEKIRAQIDPLAQKRKALDDQIGKMQQRAKMSKMSRLLTVATKARLALLEEERNKVQKNIAELGQVQRAIVNGVADGVADGVWDVD